MSSQSTPASKTAGPAPATGTAPVAPSHPATPPLDDAGPARVERWLQFILASSLVMVIGFFVPRAALRPTIGVAMALMVIGLVLLMIQSFRSPAGD